MDDPLRYLLYSYTHTRTYTHTFIQVHTHTHTNSNNNNNNNSSHHGAWAQSLSMYNNRQKDWCLATSHARTLIYNISHVKFSQFCERKPKRFVIHQNLCFTKAVKDAFGSAIGFVSTFLSRGGLPSWFNILENQAASRTRSASTLSHTSPRLLATKRRVFDATSGSF